MKNQTRTVRTFRKPRLSQFARGVLSEWQNLRLPTGDETVVVAVSGGADSTALLLSIHELKQAGRLSVIVCVAHLDHGIRDSSHKDAKWVATFARELGFEPVVGRKKVKEIARANTDNLEQAARRARYEFLERTAKRKGARFIFTGHTMDDQAETVLLRLMRGSAAIGLSGMDAIRPVRSGSKIQLVRLLLSTRRSETENYCRSRKRSFLSDEMNDDETFARVKVRKQLLPLMVSFNNKVVEALSRTASLLKEDGAELFKTADELLQRAIVTVEESSEAKGETKTTALNVTLLADAPPALRRRALRQWISEARGDARRLEMVHLKAVEKLLQGTAGGKVVELPGGLRVWRRRGRLEIEEEND